MAPTQENVGQVLRMSGKEFIQKIQDMNVQELPPTEELMVQKISHQFLQKISDFQKTPPSDFISTQLLLGVDRLDTIKLKAMREWSKQMLENPKTIGARTISLILQGLPVDGYDEDRFEKYVDDTLRDLKIIDRKLRIRIDVDGKEAWGLFGLEWQE